MRGLMGRMIVKGMDQVPAPHSRPRTAKGESSRAPRPQHWRVTKTSLQVEPSPASDPGVGILAKAAPWTILSPIPFRCRTPLPSTVRSARSVEAR